VAGLVAGLGLAFAGGPAFAQQKDVRVMMDFIIQGTHAPFFVAKEKGYYKAEGLNVTVDAARAAPTRPSASPATSTSSATSIW
jgi:NitT/TauT family transport system substrate-binding protein